MPVPEPIRVNRAPVLTLWAAVVAERLGHPPETALSLASAVAGTAARRPGDPAAPRDATRLLGRDVRLARDARGVVLADAGDGTPAPAAPVAAYLARAFGKRLAEARAAMATLAVRHDAETLNRIGFRLYEGFRPEAVTGRGIKGELRLERVTGADTGD